jgi:hypothetical protein
MSHIGLDGVNLADPAERLQESGKLGAAHSHADAVSKLCERAHDVAAEEAGAAEYGDKRFQRDGGHARSRSLSAEYRIGLKLYRAAI